jgi:4-diphosphocytidyl-2-C-methyl-D-erythritol kinase
MHRLAAAKINLSLTVRGRLASGYHALESLVAFADCGDRLHLSIADSSHLSLTGPFAAMLADENQPDNLVMKALALLEAEMGHALPSKVELEKNLPVAAGLGGGSADAAAMLHGLVALHKLEIDRNRMHMLATALGADVPVCMTGQAGWMSGIGEVVTPLALLPQADIVLVNPHIAVSTAEVFEAGGFSQDLKMPQSMPSKFSGLDELCGFLAERGNDLQRVAIDRHPMIGACLAALNKPMTQYAAMSGSGATCFALCATGNGAALAAAYRQARPDDWVHAARLVG